jgi:MMPL family protein
VGSARARERIARVRTALIDAGVARIVAYESQPTEEVLTFPAIEGGGATDRRLLSKDGRSTYLPATSGQGESGTRERIERRLEGVPYVTLGGGSFAARQVSPAAKPPAPVAPPRVGRGRIDLIAPGQQRSLRDHLPVALAILAATTLIILFFMTRSVVLPVKALVMNPQPVLLFAVAFGLSTDYGVFLLGRIKELHDAGHSNEEAVALGLQRTGPIVAFAAASMVIAIGCFVTALMRLLGDWNWWVPRPLARLLPV